MESLTNFRIGAVYKVARNRIAVLWQDSDYVVQELREGAVCVLLMFCVRRDMRGYSSGSEVGLFATAKGIGWMFIGPRDGPRFEEVA